MKQSITILVLLISVIVMQDSAAQRVQSLRLPLGSLNEPAPVHPEMSGHRLQQAHASQRHSPAMLPQSAGDYWDSLFYNDYSYLDLIDNARVTAMVSDTNFIYVAGSFEEFDFMEVWNIVAYDKHLQQWQRLGNGFNSTVDALALHDGKLYAGGHFTSEGGLGTQSMQGIAVWDGNAWSEVGGGVDASVYSIAFLGTDMIVGGDFSAAGGSAMQYIARWSGSDWDGMASSFNNTVYSLLVHDDTLYAGGAFWDNATGFHEIAMFTESYGWQPLDQGLDGSVHALAYFHDSLWAGGSFWHTADGNKDIFGLASWDGSAWHAYGPDGNLGCGHGWISSLYASSDSLFIGGLYSSMAGVSAHSLSLYTRGSFRSFGDGINGEVVSMMADDTSLVVGGTFEEPTTDVGSRHLARWSYRSGWGPAEDFLAGPYGGYSHTATYAVAANGNTVFVGGEFTSFAGLDMNHIAMYDKLSGTWTSLGAGLDGNVWSLTLVGSKLYAGGEFTYAGGRAATHIACYDLDQKRWSPLGSGADRVVYATATDGTNLFAADELVHEGQYFNSYIGKWDGSSWTRIDNPFIGWINSLYYKTPNLYAGGTIYAADLQTVSNIIMYDGSSWQPLGDGLNDRPIALASIGDDIYATGWFTASGSTGMKGIARWDGSVWHALGTGLDYAGFALSARGNDLYVGGGFKRAGGANFPALAMWDGTRWNDVAGGATYSVYGLTNDNTALYVAGGFSTVGNDLNSYRFAILHFGDASVTTIDVAPAAIVNYPNPVVSTTKIEFTVSTECDVDLALYDVFGRNVRDLVHDHRTAGRYDIELDGSTLAAGTYLCRYSACGRIEMHSITITK